MKALLTGGKEVVETCRDKQVVEVNCRRAAVEICDDTQEVVEICNNKCEAAKSGE